MTVVSQRITNLLGGVSQQSDTKKFPNQLRDSQNSYPDPTFGLIKRPGCKFVSELKSAAGTLYTRADLGNSKWFSILRDETEKYLCCIKSGQIYVWDLLTGNPKTVTYSGSGSTYLSSGTSARSFSVLSINDYTFITNRLTTVTAQAAPASWVRNRAFISVKTISYNSSYNITVNGTTVTYSTGASGTLRINDITAGLVSALSTTGVTGQAIGAGVLVTGSAAFSISVSGGQSGDALEVFQQSVPNVSKLPSQCINGYTVLVSNTSGEEDDYYAAFVADSGSTGPGIWQETLSPTVSPGLTASTMPHQLVRNVDGTFTFGPVAWEARLVGDNNSNPQPSFVDVSIRQLFFYRNRLGVLTSNNVILSQTGDYFNFYGQSALTSVDSDPIDINASSVRPSSMLAVQPSQQGLLIFGSTEQFLLSSSTESLTPSSVSIVSVSRYQVDPNNDLADLGVTTAFLAKSSAYTRVFEMETLGSNYSPYVQDLTKQVPEWIPSTVDQIAASAQNSMMALASSGFNDVYLFTYVTDGQKRVLEGWSKWVMTGWVTYMVFDGDTFWCVTRNVNSNTYAIQRMNLVQSPSAGSITTTSGLSLEPRLDMWSSDISRQLIDGDDTKIYLPYKHDSAFTVNVLVANATLTSENSPNAGTVFQFTNPLEDAGGYYVVIYSRNLTNDTLVVGYNYTYQVELPTFYYRTGDNLGVTQYSSYLAVSRIKFDLGLSGDVGFTVKAAGRSDWSTSAGSKKLNYYKLNDNPCTLDATYTLPVHQRSENFTVLITSDSPFPVAINSYTWEGNYSNRFYTRK